MNRHQLRLYIPFLFALLVLLGGCVLEQQTEYREYPVVETHLIAGRDLPPLYLSTSIPIDQEYEFDEVAVSDAQAEIHLLDANGEISQTLPYRYSQPGVFLPQTFVTHEVLSGRTYRLEVEIAGFDPIQAETTVPEAFDVVSDVPSSLVYQQDTLKVQIRRQAPSERPYVFLFQTVSDEPVVENLTPFYLDLIEREESEMDEIISNPSNPVNEANFTKIDAHTIEIQYPWIAAAFYGKNRIIANAIDSNLHDFLRSQGVQTGGSTLPPGEIPNPIYHIEGALGIFGSLSADTISTTILRPGPTP
ncbi:MAG: DUF4249 family protein [Bacteroidota bacterium]